MAKRSRNHTRSNKHKRNRARRHATCGGLPINASAQSASNASFVLRAGAISGSGDNRPIRQGEQPRKKNKPTLRMPQDEDVPKSHKPSITITPDSNAFYDAKLQRLLSTCKASDEIVLGKHNDQRAFPSIFSGKSFYTMEELSHCELYRETPLSFPLAQFQDNVHEGIGEQVNGIDNGTSSAIADERVLDITSNFEVLRNLHRGDGDQASGQVVRIGAVGKRFAGKYARNTKRGRGDQCNGVRFDRY
ncbi:hypothetical protein F5B20DRAFT_531242 [Whalleya microplaca]|nr:hypothetical protein F5B20DRAFT_531242 [Whalleya microplaca]